MLHQVHAPSRSISRSTTSIAPIARDPSFALAHANLAMAYVELAEHGAFDPDLAYPRAESAVEPSAAHRPRARRGALHDGLPAHRARLRLGERGAEFKRAIELSPSDADAYDLYGRLCAALERYDEAIALLQRAQELDPLAHRIDVATMLIRAGRYDEAIASARDAADVDPAMRARGPLSAGRTSSTDATPRGWPIWSAPHPRRPATRSGSPSSARATASPAISGRRATYLRQIKELARREYVSPVPVRVRPHRPRRVRSRPRSARARRGRAQRAGVRDQRLVPAEAPALPAALPGPAAPDAPRPLKASLDAACYASRRPIR